jgi:hypothetical protein
MATQDKRKHTRFPISVVFDILDSDGQAPLEGQGRGAVVNLSEGGAAFESEAFLEKGQHVYFELPVPVRIWAKILRVKREGVRTQYAVEFDKVKLVDLMMLRRLIKKAQLGMSKKD